MHMRDCSTVTVLNILVGKENIRNSCSFACPGEIMLVTRSMHASMHARARFMRHNLCPRQSHRGCQSANTYLILFLLHASHPFALLPPPTPEWSSQILHARPPPPYLSHFLAPAPFLPSNFSLPRILSRSLSVLFPNMTEQEVDWRAEVHRDDRVKVCQHIMSKLASKFSQSPVCSYAVSLAASTTISHFFNAKPCSSSHLLLSLSFFTTALLQSPSVLSKCSGRGAQGKDARIRIPGIYSSHH